jgi:hypothetical protein
MAAVLIQSAHQGLCSSGSLDLLAPIPSAPMVPPSRVDLPALSLKDRLRVPEAGRVASLRDHGAVEELVEDSVAIEFWDRLGINQNIMPVF